MQLSTVGKYIEAKTSLPIFRWFVNLFLIAIIYLNAQIGYKLGEYGYPLAISAVWPPTGISLASLLMFGTWTSSGIFFGNLIYNFLHLLEGSNSLLSVAVVALCMSAASTLQALLAAYCIQKYTKGNYLGRVKDVVIFLLPGGILPCLIASTVGVTALYLSSILVHGDVFQTWLTFWLGDTMGVLIFTPLIIVWSIFKPHVLFKKYHLEAGLILVGFLLVTLLTYSIRTYPLAHLMLPLSFWATYRFRMHGATLSTFILMLVMVVPAVIGQGPYMIPFGNPLLLVISYVGVVASLVLLLAALLNEQDEELLRAQKMEAGGSESFTALSGQQVSIPIPMNIRSVTLSLTQNPDIRIADENMIISARQQAETILVQIQLPK